MHTCTRGYACIYAVGVATTAKRGGGGGQTKRLGQSQLRQTTAEGMDGEKAVQTCMHTCMHTCMQHTCMQHTCISGLWHGRGHEGRGVRRELPEACRRCEGRGLELKVHAHV